MTQQSFENIEQLALEDAVDHLPILIDKDWLEGNLTLDEYVQVQFALANVCRIVATSTDPSTRALSKNSDREAVKARYEKYAYGFEVYGAIIGASVHRFDKETK